jgi:hypothetical protein
MKGRAMADDSAEEAIAKAGAEHDAKYSANRQRFEAQSWYEIDHRLTLLLAPLFRMGDDSTIELTVVVDGTVISGSVVSEHAWTQRQNDQIRIGSPAVANALAAADSKTAVDSKTAADSKREEQGLKAVESAEVNRPQRQDRYLHFLAPVLLSGGVHVRLPATRVDLRKVAAWSIGRISLD